nr:uncharacterized protein LOC113820284 [Penaeus vannamei]
MSDSDSEESQGSCACSCDARCVRSPTPTSSRRGAESTSGCPSSDFLPSDPISGHASPSADFRIADSGVVVGRPWRRPQPPATPDMKASRDVSVKQKRSRMPPGAVELGVKSPRAARPPRFPAATSSGCPSPSRSERSGWWDQQQLSPVSCASGYWDDEQPLRDWDDDDPRHGRDDAHRVSPESEGSGESERLKALFTACDTDGDGYITSVKQERHSMAMQFSQLQQLIGLCKNIQPENSLKIPGYSETSEVLVSERYIYPFSRETFD